MVGAIPARIATPLAALGIALAVFMLAPLLVVIIASFSASEFLVFPPRGLSMRWYVEILGSGEYLAAAATSLRLALIVTVLALLIGTPAAIALARHRLPGGGMLAGLFLSPLVLPTIVLGIGLLMVASRYLDGPSFWVLAVGHTVVTIPYVIRTVVAALAGLDPHIEEAAQVMGAGFWQRQLLVVLPQCKTGMAAGAFLAFNISFDEAVVALFLRTPDLTTLPLVIYGKLEFSPDPSVAAVASVMIAVTVLLIVMADRIVGLDRLSG